MTDSDQEARRGPRPLPLHLTMAALTYASSNAALPLLRNGSLDSSHLRTLRPSQLESLVAEIAEADPVDLQLVVESEARRRLGKFLDGVETYRVHPYRRDLEDPPAVWQEGSTRLLRYRAEGGRPALVIPSLVNRAYVLDLSSRGSFLRWLATQGIDGYLVDWGAPGPRERNFDLTDYVAGRLEAAFQAVQSINPGPVTVVGYCMGGDLALALALRRQSRVAGLALLATPWDFHAEASAQALAIGAAGYAFEPNLALFGELSSDIIQMLFCTLDPMLAVRKFTRFSGLDPESVAALDFVALEDWLNDGVPLSAPVARECLVGWYGENRAARGEWRVAGDVVDPARFGRPALTMIPAQDRIVPPQSAAALAAALPNCTVLRPAAGHIGMMVGSKALRQVWEPFAGWIDSLPD